MALPGGVNRINEWPVPNQSGTPSGQRCGSRPACPVPGAVGRRSPHPTGGGAVSASTPGSPNLLFARADLVLCVPTWVP